MTPLAAKHRPVRCPPAARFASLERGRPSALIPQFIRMPSFLLGLIGLALIAPIPVAAQWTPLWLGTDDAIGQPFEIRAAVDGAVFAGVDIVRDNTAHATLIRYEGDGRFAWKREYGRGRLLDVALIGGARIGVVHADDSSPHDPAFLSVTDAASGEVLWQREFTASWWAADYNKHVLAEAPNGDLLLRLNEGGDYVVARFDADGNALPSWRWHSKLDSVAASDLAVLPDGGAVVTGHGNLREGYRTVRLDADGEAVFVDVEMGDIGNPLGPARLAVDADGGIVLGASPETEFGVDGAMIWKLGADGARAWTTVLPRHGSETTSSDSAGFLLTATGDVLANATGDPGDRRPRLLFLRGTDGSVAWERRAALTGTPTSMALAPNGRVLIAGFEYIPGSGGRTHSFIVEFTREGRPCRSNPDIGLAGFTYAAAGVAGWTVLGADLNAVVQRYDADGACTEDAIFSDGFDLQSGS